VKRGDPIAIEVISFAEQESFILAQTTALNVTAQ
jgi:hypothetical protein